MMERVISNDAEDRRAQDALGACLASGELPGKSRDEVATILGSGQPATVFSPTFGFTSADWYWTIGKLPPNMVGGVPNLVARFDAADRCVEARFVHTQ